MKEKQCKRGREKRRNGREKVSSWHLFYKQKEGHYREDRKTFSRYLQVKYCINTVTPFSKRALVISYSRDILSGYGLRILDLDYPKFHVLVWNQFIKF